MMLQMHVQSSVASARQSAKAPAVAVPRVSCARVARPSTRPTLAAQPETGRRELVRLAVAEQDSYTESTEASYGEPSPEAAEAESSQVFVANLPFSVSSDDLGDHFSRCAGYMRAIVLMRDGRSRGIGLVDFESPAAAQQAVEEMNETDFNGRNLLARISVPPPKREYGERRQYGDREQRQPYGERRQQYGGEQRQQYGERRQQYGDREQRQPYGDRAQRPPRPPSAPGSTLYVSNLSYDTTWMEVKDYFGAAGQVEFAKVLSSADGRSRGCGMVTFSSAQEADAAIEQLNESELGGRRLNVRKFIPREE